MGIALVLAGTGGVVAMSIVGESPERHYRFESGYSADSVLDPQPNTSPEFIAGEFDLSGVCWNPSNPRQSYVFLSRRHVLVAQHFSGGSQVQYFSGVTGLGTVARSSLQVLPDSDIAIARLATLVPASAQISIYPGLDLPSLSSYVGRDLMMYGWVAKMGLSKVSSVYASAVTINGSPMNFLFLYEGPGARDDFVTLQGQDSGSPAFFPHEGRLALAGNHYAIIDGGVGGGADSFVNHPDAVSQINTVLQQDGFAMQFLLEPAKQWNSNSNQNWSVGGNWSSTGAPTSSQTVGFDGGSGAKTINLGANRTVKGIRFTGLSEQSGFTITGSQTLTVGYVGIRNEAPTTQLIAAPVVVGAPQHWTAASGGIIIQQPVSLGSNILNLSGPEEIQFNATISGSGGVAVQSGTTRIGAADYSGPTYLYGGELQVLWSPDFQPSGPIVLGGGRLRVWGTSADLPAPDLRDTSEFAFDSDTSTVHFAAPTTAWAPGVTLAITNFDPAIHSVQFGDSFSSLTAEQRAAITINGEPVIYREDGGLGIATPYERWALEHFPNEAGNPETAESLWAPSASPAGDGVENLVKYALGMDPNAQVPGGVLQPILGSDDHLTAIITPNPAATEAEIIPEVSGNLTDWFSGAEHVSMTEIDGAIEIRDLTPSSGDAPRFLRLRVRLDY